VYAKGRRRVIKEGTQGLEESGKKKSTRNKTAMTEKLKKRGRGKSEIKKGNSSRGSGFRIVLCF
jgi:hypothetical protein